LCHELAIRLSTQEVASITRGTAIEKCLAPPRSFMFEPMRQGQLLLCGDAAHIVPVSGAKGLNLAASDVHYTAQAVIIWYDHGDGDGVAAYAGKRLARV
jgi:p-hydroxybenzoate 3-monooxygenase